MSFLKIRSGSIIRLMINFTLKSGSTSSIKPSLILITIISMLTMISKSQVCTHTIFQNSTGKSCQFHYSYDCNITKPLHFDFCTYYSCSQQPSSNPCSSYDRINSPDLSICINICISKPMTETASAGDWFAIILIVFCCILIIGICGCITRRCCRNSLPDHNQFIMRMPYPSPSAEENEIESQRRLSSWNYLEFQLKWLDLNENPKWISEQQTCVICLDKDLNSCLPCQHYYHNVCIKEWLKLKDFCPTCKADRFDQIRIRCKGCKAKEMTCFVEQLKKIQIENHCPNCR